MAKSWTVFTRCFWDCRHQRVASVLKELHFEKLNREPNKGKSKVYLSPKKTAILRDPGVSAWAPSKVVTKCQLWCLSWSSLTAGAIEMKNWRRALSCTCNRELHSLPSPSQNQIPGAIMVAFPSTRRPGISCCIFILI